MSVSRLFTIPVLLKKIVKIHFLNFLLAWEFTLGKWQFPGGEMFPRGGGGNARGSSLAGSGNSSWESRGKIFPRGKRNTGHLS